RSAGSLRQRGIRVVQPPPVVLDQLPSSSSSVTERLAVSGIDDPRRKLDRALERRQIVAEGVRPAVRIEADRRRDRTQKMIATDQHSVAEETEMPIRVPGELEHLPAVDLAALVEQHRVDRVADEGCERVTLGDEILRHRRGRSVPHEPVGHPFRPVLAPPDALALRVVETALVDRSPGAAGGRLGAPNVVRMEVGDRDPRDVRLAPRRLSKSEAGVEERSIREIAVDVLRPGRTRQCQAVNTVLELYERLFYTACRGQCGSSIAKSPARAP